LFVHVRLRKLGSRHQAGCRCMSRNYDRIKVRMTFCGKLEGESSHFGFLGRDGSISLDESSEDTTSGFDTSRERRNVEKEEILGLL
jgi:hypothetical protein